FMARGDSARAAAAFDRALDGAGDSEDDSEGDCLAAAARDAAREHAAALALKANRPARAFELLAGLRSTGATTNRGFALIQLGRPAEGMLEFERALRDAPDDPESSFGRALALVRLRRVPEAVVALRAFADRWPRHFAAAEARRLLSTLGRSGEFLVPGAVPPYHR
ncbi:MAG: tetratricopeptide repeat protein, partial [Pseudomonadota bacterium]